MMVAYFYHFVVIVNRKENNLWYSIAKKTSKNNRTDFLYVEGTAVWINRNSFQKYWQNNNNNNKCFSTVRSKHC